MYTGEARFDDQLCPLWRLLEKRRYQKKGIIRLAGISESTYRKLLAGEAVRIDS